MHLFQQLDNDWKRIVAGADGRRACLRWSRLDPVLADVKCPQDLVHEIRTCGDPARSDELLSAIIRLAPNDALAARVVFQALIPGMRCIVRRLSSHADIEEIEATVVASAWTRIRTYPYTKRPRRIAANVILDTRKRCINSLLNPSNEVLMREVPAQPAEESQEADLESTLRSAHQDGWLSVDEVRLITRTRLLGFTLCSEASTAEVSSEALRKRRARAERRLLSYQRLTFSV